MRSTYIVARSASLQPECNLPRLSEYRPQSRTFLERLTERGQGKKTPSQRLKETVLASITTVVLRTVIVLCLILVGLSHKQKRRQQKFYLICCWSAQTGGEPAPVWVAHKLCPAGPALPSLGPCRPLPLGASRPPSLLAGSPHRARSQPPRVCFCGCFCLGRPLISWAPGDLSAVHTQLPPVLAGCRWPAPRCLSPPTEPTQCAAAEGVEEAGPLRLSGVWADGGASESLREADWKDNTAGKFWQSNFPMERIVAL